MIKEVTAPAPAKINLHLAVGSTRPDGYHDIASIFQAVSFYDSVHVALRGQMGITLDAACNCASNKNTAYTAADIFLNAAARNGPEPVPGVHIVIEKRIPMGAGLGGGSSDAASTLKAMSLLLPGFIGNEELYRIAGMVGSDVPFFLGSACATVTGRGEKVTPLAPREDYSIVILDPGFSIATKDAYHSLDTYRDRSRASPERSWVEPERSLEGVVDAYARLEPEAWPFRNDFYDAVSELYPDLTGCHESLTRTGALFVSMSGSGSAMYGLYASPADAKRAMMELSARYAATVAFPLARLPLSI